MAVCFRKRPLPTMDSTPSPDMGTESRRTSRFRRGDGLQAETVGLRLATTTPATTDGQRHHSCVASARSFAEPSAVAVAGDAAPASPWIVPLAHATIPADQAEGPAAAETDELSASPCKPLPPVAARDLRARAAAWDWTSPGVPIPPDTRPAATRVSIGLLLRASEAVGRLFKPPGNLRVEDSAALRAKLLTWLVADAMGCALPDADAAFRKGKAMAQYIKGQDARVASIEKQARAEAAKPKATSECDFNQLHSRAAQLISELCDSDSPYNGTPEFTPPAAEPSPAPSVASEGELAGEQAIAETAVSIEALPARLLSLRPAPRLESYAKDVSPEVRVELDEAGYLPPSAISGLPTDIDYHRQPVYAAEMVEYAFGDATARERSLANFAEMNTDVSWRLVEQALKPAAPSDYPEMIVEIYHRARELEFELAKMSCERDRLQLVGEAMKEDMEKSARVLYEEKLRLHMEQEKCLAEEAHQAEMKRRCQFSAQFGMGF